MTPRLRISSINEKQLNKRVTLNGWVRTRRGSKGISFIQLYDGSNQNGIQAVADEILENYEEISRLTTGTSVSITGKVVESPAKGQAFEIHAEKVRVIGTSSGELYPLQKKGLSLEFLREIAHMRTRTNTLGAVFRLRNTLSWATHSFFQERNFLYVQTPIITANDAEGAGEMFHVTALDLENLPRNSEGKVDYTKDFFGTDVSLTVSGQLGQKSLRWHSQMFTHLVQLSVRKIPTLPDTLLNSG